MKAQVGDRFIVAGTHVDEPRREGIIVGLSHPDGSPPYQVRWLADDHESLLFPGPDAQLVPQEANADRR